MLPRRRSKDIVTIAWSLTGARSADLAARAGITRQSMGEVVRELVGMGVLEMTVDPDDARAKRVTYTRAGLQQVEAGRAYVADFDRRLIAELGEDGYQALRHGLDVVVGLLEESRDG